HVGAFRLDIDYRPDRCLRRRAVAALELDVARDRSFSGLRPPPTSSFSRGMRELPEPYGAPVNARRRLERNSDRSREYAAHGHRLDSSACESAGLATPRRDQDRLA